MPAGTLEWMLIAGRRKSDGFHIIVLRCQPAVLQAVAALWVLLRFGELRRRQTEDTLMVMPLMCSWQSTFGTASAARAGAGMDSLRDSIMPPLNEESLLSRAASFATPGYRRRKMGDFLL